MSNAILMIRSCIFRLILLFLHIVYSGLQYFDTAWALFKRKLPVIFLLEPNDPQLYVSRFVRTLDKCPSHFAVVTGTERIHFEDFSNLVMWCIAAGISIISFYDYTGYLKENQDSYYKYLLSKRDLDKQYIIFNERRSEIKNGLQKNGFTKKIHVNVLSMEDGKPLFAKFVENLSKRILDDEIKTADIDENFIDEEMHKILGFTDPELALVCGNVCGTFGFLPWHIRLTEFLQVPSIQNIRVYDFTSSLKWYSSCSQRFGR